MTKNRFTSLTTPLYQWKNVRKIFKIAKMYTLMGSLPLDFTCYCHRRGVVTSLGRWGGPIKTHLNSRAPPEANILYNHFNPQTKIWLLYNYWKLGLVNVQYEASLVSRIFRNQCLGLSRKEGISRLSQSQGIQQQEQKTTTPSWGRELIWNNLPTHCSVRRHSPTVFIN